MSAHIPSPEGGGLGRGDRRQPLAARQNSSLWEPRRTSSSVVSSGLA
jgi:hypothetical protein